MKVFGGLVLMKALSIEQKSDVVWGELNMNLTYVLSLAVCVHELLELGTAFDLEKDLFAVLTIIIDTWLFTLRLSCSALVAGCSAIRDGLYRIGSTSK